MADGARRGSIPGDRHRLYFIPDANHYLQVDRPDAFVKVLLHALEPADDHEPGALEAELGAPLLVDTSRERLSAAADLLRADAAADMNLKPNAPERRRADADPGQSPDFFDRVGQLCGA